MATWFMLTLVTSLLCIEAPVGGLLYQFSTPGNAGDNWKPCCPWDRRWCISYSNECLSCDSSRPIFSPQLTAIDTEAIMAVAVFHKMLFVHFFSNFFSKNVICKRFSSCCTRLFEQRAVVSATVGWRGRGWRYTISKKILSWMCVQRWKKCSD